MAYEAIRSLRETRAHSSLCNQNVTARATPKFDNLTPDRLDADVRVVVLKFVTCTPQKRWWRVTNCPARSDIDDRCEASGIRPLGKLQSAKSSTGRAAREALLGAR